LVFEGEGKVREYAGGYEDWLRQSAAGPRKEAAGHASVPPAVAVAERRNNENRKLSYKEQRELEALPEKIESLEAEQAKLHTLMGDGNFYRQPSDKIAAAMDRLEAVKNELEDCYTRWQSLETRARAASG
jgi:ATP-binding cassette subfamily F protein uup